MPKTKRQIIGQMGEGVACKFLLKKGFSIVARNYWKKCGEIDIIAKKNGCIHFVEVKTVSCKNLDQTEDKNPEDNIHFWKLKRLSRVIQTYLIEKSLEDINWGFSVALVFLDESKRLARVKVLDDIVLE
ncbi:YraN family protein [Patescibacteria group bacterium]